MMHKFKTKFLPITSNFDGFRFSVSCNNKNDITFEKGESGEWAHAECACANNIQALYLLSYGIVDATAASSSAVDHSANVEVRLLLFGFEENFL